MKVDTKQAPAIEILWIGCGSECPACAVFPWPDLTGLGAMAGSGVHVDCMGRSLRQVVKSLAQVQSEQFANAHDRSLLIVRGYPRLNWLNSPARVVFMSTK